MIDWKHILRYFGSNCKFTAPYSYKDFRKGLRGGKKKFKEHWSEDMYITPLTVPRELIREKEEMARRIASHLWGGNEEIQGMFHSLKILSFEEITYADTKPIKVSVVFGDSLKKAFYVKKFDDRRFFGLELENMLSQYKYSYSIGDGTIYEDEIFGEEGMEIDERTRKDPAYLEELVKLDFRCFAMLLGDMHDQNYLVSRQEAGEKYAFCVRPIDFDRLFDIKEDVDDLRDVFLLYPERRQRIRGILGDNMYLNTIDFERERMRKIYYEQEGRFKVLSEMIGISKDCNLHLSSVSKLCAKYYGDNAKGVYFCEAKNMGVLLENHLREQLIGYI